MELEDFRHGGTNITCLRLVDPENPLVQRVIQDWVFGELRYGRTVDAPNSSLQVRVRPVWEWVRGIYTCLASVVCARVQQYIGRVGVCASGVEPHVVCSEQVLR